jgi:hypothetical protein
VVLRDSRDLPEGHIVIGSLSAGRADPPAIGADSALFLAPPAQRSSEDAGNTKPATTLIERLANALRGIASCATACRCCEMHRRMAEEALASIDSPEGSS